MFGQQRSQSGPGGLSINTGSANLFGPSNNSNNNNNNATQGPLSGSLLGSSKPLGLFGQPTITTAPQSGGLFGTSSTNTGGGLFGTQANQYPPTNQSTINQAQPQGGTFPESGNMQAGSSLFAPKPNPFSVPSGSTNLGPNQPQQPQGGGGLFGALNKPSLFSGGQSQGQAQQRPTFGTQSSSFLQQQQPQQSLFSSSIGQYSQQQQTVPGVRINLSELRSTTRFNDLHEEVQKIIENVDNFILGQIKLSGECDDMMPKVDSAFSSMPRDVEYCSRKLDAIQQALESDAGDIDFNKKLVRKDAADARLSFRAIERLRMPQQFQHSSLWNSSNTTQPVGPEPEGEDGEAGASTDLVSYFSKQADEMTKTLESFKKNMTEVETYLKGVETSTVQQMQRVQFTRRRDGGQRSADDQVRELAAVLREFESGILGVAGKVGGVREQVQENMLGNYRSDGSGKNRRHGQY